jgi:membrane protein
MVFYFGIAVLYRYGSATHRRFPVFSAGTTLATILCMLSSIAFSFYIDEFNRYDSYHKFYGSIGTFIIIMLWIQINSLILLIGFELNAAIAVNRDLKTKIEDEN